MKPSGLVLTIAGIWVLCQVLGGNALGRLGISGSAAPAGSTGAGSGGGTTGPGYNGPAGGHVGGGLV